VTRQEFTDAVAQLLGIHATEERVSTIVLLADAYASSYAVLHATRVALSGGRNPPPGTDRP
jgi:hypothetical protein